MSAHGIISSKNTDGGDTDRFRALNDLSPAGIFEGDIHGDCIYVNKCWCEMAGLTPRQALGKGWIEGIHRNDREKVSNGWYKMVESGGPWGTEYRFVNRSGKVTRVYVTAVIIRDGSGIVTGYLGITNDITPRKKIGDDLKNPDDKYRSLFDASRDAVFLTDPTGCTYAANRSACSLFGYSEADLIRLGRQGVVDRTDPRLKIALEDRKKNGSFFGELRFIKADGTNFEAEISTSTFDDRSGKQFSSVVVRDISQRKRIEDVLKKDNERFELATRSGKIAIWDWDILTGDLEWYDSIDNMIFSDNGKLPRTMDARRSIIHPEDRKRVESTFSACLDGKAQFDIEYRVGCSDGSSRWWHDVGDVKRDASGKAIRMVGSCTDITARKNAEEDLLEHRIQTNLIFDQTPTIMCVIDDDRRILFGNTAFIKASKWPDAARHSSNACGALGCMKSLNDPKEGGFGPECEKCDLRIAITDTIRTGRPHKEIEYQTRINKNGVMTDVIMLGSTTSVGNGGKKRMLLSLMDISHLKEIELNLALSREMYMKLFTESPDPIFTMDRGLLLMDANSAALRLTGSSNETIIGRDFLQILPFNDRSRRLLEKTLRTEPENLQISFAEVCISRDDGPLFLDLHWTHLRGNNMLQVIAHDITARKQFEMEMRRKLMDFRIDEGDLYLAREGASVEYLEALKELSSLGFHIHVFCRRADSDRLSRTFRPASVQILSRLMTDKVVHTSRIMNLSKKLRKNDVLFISDLDYISRDEGPDSVIKLVQDLRDTIDLNGFTGVIATNGSAFTEQDIKCMEKECTELARRAEKNLDGPSRVLLDLILGYNLKGEKPSHTHLAADAGLSKPTLRKRIRTLMELGLVREVKIGRSKNFEVTGGLINR